MSDLSSFPPVNIKAKDERRCIGPRRCCHSLLVKLACGCTTKRATYFGLYGSTVDMEVPLKREASALEQAALDGTGQFRVAHGRHPLCGQLRLTIRTLHMECHLCSVSRILREISDPWTQLYELQRVRELTCFQGVPMAPNSKTKNYIGYQFRGAQTRLTSVLSEDSLQQPPEHEQAEDDLSD